jgi:4-amino-4-deoxy-L-arabinose transferase-like glycosyltransferase
MLVSGIIGYPQLPGISFRTITGLLSRLPSLRPEMILLVLITVAFVLVYAISSLVPTLEGDSLADYLLLARAYAQHHKLVMVDFTGYHASNSFPQNGMLICTLGFLLSGQILAQVLVAFSMGLFCIGITYAIGRTWFSRKAAIVAIAVWYCTACVAYLSASAKFDLAWAAFDLCSLLSFSRWFFARPGERQDRWLLLAGIFLGIAGGIKQVSVFTIVVLSIGIVWRVWQESRFNIKAWVRPVLILALPASMAFVWMVRAYFSTGQFFALGQDTVNYHGITGFFRVLWEMSMLGNAWSVEGPRGKSIGPALLALLPLLCLVKNRNPLIRPLLIFCALMVVLWFLGVQRARHLLPTLAVASLVAGFILVRFADERPLLGRFMSGLVILSLCIVFGSTAYVQLVSINRIPYVLGAQNFDAYLEKNLLLSRWSPAPAIFRYMRDSLPADARIAMFPTGLAYYLGKPAYSGWRESPRSDTGSLHLRKELQEKRITHVFVNPQAAAILDCNDAWMMEPGFQEKNLTELMRRGDQSLFAMKK